MKKIDYEKLIQNIESIINVLEYDSMRSSGKAKLNSNDLVNMYNLLDRYNGAEKKVEAPVQEKKPVGRPPKAAAK